MSLYSDKQFLKVQIIETERLFQMVKNHPLMSITYEQRLKQLKEELDNLPEEVLEPKIHLLFSGDAVKGGEGVKATFIGKVMPPFEEMVKIQVATVRFGLLPKKGKRKRATKTELFLTALPTGSFGVELKQLQFDTLFDAQEVATGMKQVINIVAQTAKDDNSFEATIENTPKKNLHNLKKFLEEINEEKSILKMECGELGIELSTKDVADAYLRVSEVVNNEEDEFINGIFRGLLLDSAKFEFQDEQGRKHLGNIGQNLSEDELIGYDKMFLNQQCKIHVKKNRIKFKTGNEKVVYELLEITNIN